MHGKPAESDTQWDVLTSIREAKSRQCRGLSQPHALAKCRDTCTNSIPVTIPSTWLENREEVKQKDFKEKG
jgi:hypothetical protein